MWILSWSLAAAACAGCGRAAGDGQERLVPDSAPARSALEMALTDWRSGRPPGLVRKSAPAVQLVDSHRVPGQRLADYKVLGEIHGAGPRSFLVHLHLQNPIEERKERYCVLGIDPLWVCAQCEYDMILHWECWGNDTKPAAQAARVQEWR
jgi:hypothetical protein